MKEQRRFLVDGDRYIFDFGCCSIKKGFAQVDTGQDAWYFGTWANPETLEIVSYTEGDLVVKTAETAAEFCCELRQIQSWNVAHGHGFKGIDAGLGDLLADRFRALGVGDLLHKVTA